MTYDPYRNTTPSSTPPPREPFQDFHRDPDGGTGTSFLLGALILVALGGFIYYYAAGDHSDIATDNLRPPVTQQSTTGSGTPAETTPQPARPAQ